jgi:zinc protease
MRVVLSNGCVLIAQSLPHLPLVTVHGFIKGGALWDAPNKSGVAQLMAQVMRRGTDRHTAEEIDDLLERRGAELSLSVHHEGLTIQLSCLPQDFADCAALMAEVLQRPTFPEEEVAKQRQRMLNALRDALTRPEEVSRRLFLRLAYPPDHPFHLPPEGTPESVEGLTRDDLLATYHHLAPNHAIFVAVGNLPEGMLLDCLADALGDWQNANEPREPSFPPAPLPPTTIRERQSLPDRTQCWVTMGHKGLRRTDERFYAANILATILGAGWGRLFTQIRDNQGLAYAVGAFLQAGLGEGPFAVRIGVNPKDVDRAIESALTELTKIRQEPPSPEEVTDAKNYLLGRLVLSMENSEGVASLLVSCELFGLGLDYPQRAKSFYEPITPEQVLEVAQSVLHPDRMAIAIAGP